MWFMCPVCQPQFRGTDEKHVFFIDFPLDANFYIPPFLSPVNDCHWVSFCRMSAILTKFWEHAKIGIWHVSTIPYSWVTSWTTLALFCFASLGTCVAVCSALILNQKSHLHWQIPSHYIVHLQCIYCYMSIVSQLKKKSSIICCFLWFCFYGLYGMG